MIGIDMVKCSRIKHLMEKYPQKALSRFLSEDEMGLVKSYRTASGFWAVKEATSKALGVGISAECSFFDITISKTKHGAPNVELSKKIVDKFNIKDISVSITHDGDYAIAVVAIEREQRV